jgi:hypothetical protein
VLKALLLFQSKRTEVFAVSYLHIVTSLACFQLDLLAFMVGNLLSTVYPPIQQPTENELVQQSVCCQTPLEWGL